MKPNLKAPAPAIEVLEEVAVVDKAVKVGGGGL